MYQCFVILTGEMVKYKSLLLETMLLLLMLCLRQVLHEPFNELCRHKTLYLALELKRIFAPKLRVLELRNSNLPETKLITIMNGQSLIIGLFSCWCFFSLSLSLSLFSASTLIVSSTANLSISFNVTCKFVLQILCCLFLSSSTSYLLFLLLLSLSPSLNSLHFTCSFLFLIQFCCLPNTGRLLDYLSFSLEEIRFKPTLPDLRRSSLFLLLLMLKDSQHKKQPT